MKIRRYNLCYHTFAGALLSRRRSKKRHLWASDGYGTFVPKKSTDDDSEICHFEEQYHGKNCFPRRRTGWRRNDGRAARVRKLSIDDKLEQTNLSIHYLMITMMINKLYIVPVMAYQHLFVFNIVGKDANNYLFVIITKNVHRLFNYSPILARNNVYKDKLY